MELAGVLSIGLLLSISFLDKEIKGIISNNLLVRKAKNFIFVWFLLTILFILVQIAYLLEQPLSASFDLTVIRSYMTQTSIGKSYLIQIILLILILIIPIKKILTSYFLLLLSIIAIIAPVFQSHGSSSGHHALAIGALTVHVIAISFWVGGLFGLTQLDKTQKLIALPRFSAMALWSAITVAVTGSATAWTRLDSITSLQSKYGVITILKIFLTVILIGFGAIHRRWIIKSDFPAIFKLVIAEIIIMFTTIFIGSWLSTVAPPSREVISTPALLITGIPMPDAPTLSKVLLAYDADGLMLSLLIFAVALYIKGVLILSRRGDRWPIGRTISFALGISAVDFATSGGLGVYSHFAFANHMLAHMVLGMIAPIGIVLGAPITLALRTLPIGRTQDERGVRGYAIAILHSRYSSIITHPVSALIIFEASLFALYFTNLFNWLMSYHFGHFFMGLHFLLSGILLFFVIIGVDPTPQKSPFIFRIVILFVAISIHAFFSVALMSSSQLVDGGYFAEIARPWWPDFLADQKMGASIGWAMGEIPILLALIATFLQWIRADERDAKRIERNSNRARQFGEPDELDKYNQYLSGLNQRNGSPDKTDKEANN